MPFGRLLGSTWSSWKTLGSSQRHLNSTCFPSGLLLPLQADLQAQLGLHLAFQTGLQEQLGTSWGPLELNLALWGAFWVQFEASWMPFGRLRGSTSSSWTPLVSSQRHLNSTCFPSGLQVQLGLHSGFQLNSKRQLELHFGQQSSCRISFVIPEGLPGSTILHLYHPKGC